MRPCRSLALLVGRTLCRVTPSRGFPDVNAEFGASFREKPARGRPHPQLCWDVTNKASCPRSLRVAESSSSSRSGGRWFSCESAPRRPDERLKELRAELDAIRSD